MNTTEQNNGARELDDAVAAANQAANLILLALRTVHEYIVPRALKHGIKLSAREQHAWSVSLSIALSQSKVQWKMPATRLEKPAQKRALKTPQKAPSLFTERKQESEVLSEVRGLMKTAGVTEVELLEIMREAGTKEAMFAANLSAIPDKVLRLTTQRWETIVELAEAGRTS